MMMPRHRLGVDEDSSHESALVAKQVRGENCGGIVTRAQAMLRALWPRGLSGPRPPLTEGITLPKVLRMLTDATIILIALIVAQALRHGYHQTLEAEPGSHGLGLTLFSLSNLHSTAWILLISVVIFASNGFYTYGSTYQSRYKFLIISQAVTINYLVIGTVSFLFPVLISIPRSVLLLAWAISWALLECSRLWSTMWRYIIAVEGTAEPRSPVRVTAGEPSVLVIGGAGYIGSALLPKLLERGSRVRVLDLLIYGEEPIRDVVHSPDLEIIQADFRQIDALVKAVQNVDVVVHLGGLVGDPACACDEELTVDINLAATRAVADVAKGAGVNRLIFASTCSVYGASDEMLDERSWLNPLSIYARSKVASEKVLVQAASEEFKPIIVRFATVHGLSGRTRFDLVVNLLAAKALLDGEITVIGGDQWRPFVHVDDAASAISMLLHRRIPAAEYPFILNVGSTQQNFTIQQVADMVHLQVPTARLVKQTSDADRRNYRVNFDKIERAIGYRTRYTVEEGIAQVIEAVNDGRIIDYRDPAYSNFSFLNGGGMAFFTRPRPQWARELMTQAGP
jgi:nucleoside-diphosphate-sugar epimerase